MSYQVNREIQALDQAAGFLRDDPLGVAALWDTAGQLADEPRPPESFPYGCQICGACELTGTGSSTRSTKNGR